MQVTPGQSILRFGCITLTEKVAYNIKLFGKYAKYEGEVIQEKGGQA